MDRKLIKWVAACVLSVGSAASALAASVTSPGQQLVLRRGCQLLRASISPIPRTGGAGIRARNKRVSASMSRSSFGQLRGRFWAGDWNGPCTHHWGGSGH